VLHQADVKEMRYNHIDRCNPDARDPSSLIAIVAVAATPSYFIFFLSV
jgi:hypothetical protein